MADEERDVRVAERMDKAECIARQIEEADAWQIPGIVSGGSAIAPLVGGNGVESCLPERWKLVPPREAKLGKAMEQEGKRAVLWPGFEDMHGKAIDAGNDAGADRHQAAFLNTSSTCRP
jgi:hypothetical protein